MKNRNGIITMLAIVIVTIFACKPDPLEYARPENLTGTIYAQLESMGTFNYYLQSLDQTEFKEPLVKGGSWTVFAPTDEAFEQFMSDEGFASFDAIPSDRVLHFIEHSIIVDGWNTTTLTYYPSQFYLGTSFKRITQYRDTIVEVDAQDYPNFIDWQPGKYLLDVSSGRDKTISYFIQEYIDYDLNPMENSDYDFMFPGETYNTGDMKVYNAHVTQKNIIAENGIIYALDKVLEPRNNLYQNLTSEEYEGKYTLFKSLLNRFGYFQSVGEELNELTNVSEEIYQIRFETGIENDLLPFALNGESYPSLIPGGSRTLANALGVLVPTNEALTSFLEGNTILGRTYDSYDDMPQGVLGKFLAINFFQNYYEICPSNFGQTFNMGLDFVDYKEEDIVDKKLCSNGLFVGVDKVYINPSFTTVLGPLLLDPDYSIMLKAINDLAIDDALQSSGVKFSVLGIKNDQFIDVADPNSATRKITVLNDITPEDLSVIYMEVTGDPNNANNRTYPVPNTSPSSSDIDYVTTTLKDIVLNQIIEEDIDLNSDNYYQTKSGDFVYVTGGSSVFGGGNISNGQSVEVESVEETENGNFYEMSSFIERPLYFTYGALAGDSSGSYSLFLDALSAADATVDISDSTDKLVSFLNLLKTFTLFVPNNTAVNQAIADGVIVDPNSLPTDALDLAIAKRDLLNFVKKHFLQQAITTDGKTTGTFSSLYFGKVVDFVPVYDKFTVQNSSSPASLTITNTETEEVVTTGSMTNLLSKGVVIHEIDNYLK